jgi:hypothetical protein
LTATVGGYLAAFLVPAAALVAGGLPSAGVLAVAAVVVGGLGVALGHGSPTTETLASPTAVGTVVLAPLSLLWFPLTRSLSDGLLVASAVGVGASGLGLLAAATAAHCRTRDRIAAATEYAVAETDDAGDGLLSDVDSRTVGAVTLVGAGVLVAVAALTVLEGDGLGGAVTGFGALSTLFTLFTDDPDRVAVTDAGLVVDGRLHETETLAGATFDDGDLIVERTSYRADVTVERDRFGTDAVDRLAAALGQIADAPAGVENGGPVADGDDSTRDNDDGVPADDGRERERA